MPDHDLYISYKSELDNFERYYFDARNIAFSEVSLDVKIERLTEIIERSKAFEKFCKDVGLSKYLNEMYKQSVSSKGKTNLFKTDQDTLKRCKLLKKIVNRLEKLSLPELQSVEEHIKLLKQPRIQSPNSTDQPLTKDKKLSKFFGFLK